ncbi:MAG: OmpW family outer membrane protein [Pseudohongiella sp.]|nr:OmpW family outer membrane protein [Pseudohongiella sp.]MDO9519234.1 OmpW family outer membrane protein [Pseudohongiella sp.]MDP2128345.1 OmpW family outer membrane protein [Pseudohongiella sp.]
MNTTIKTLGSAVILATFMSTPALAQLELSGGLVQVAPSSVNSNDLTLNGVTLPTSVSDINGDNGYFVGLSYNIDSEFSIGATANLGLTHRVREAGLGIGDAGRFELEVFTLTGKYRFPTEMALKPYFQAGVIHLHPREGRATSEMKTGLGTDNIGLVVNRSTGFIAGAGAEIWSSERLGFFGEASYSWADTAASFSVDGATLRASGIDVNPIVYRLGAIVRF